jgi:hypothetical protein
MSEERAPDLVQSLWQDQPAAPITISIDELREHSRRLTRRVNRRNLREYAAAVVAAIAFVPTAWFAPLRLMRIGSVLSLAAVTFVVYHLHRYGAAQTLPAEMALTSGLAFLRRELERQRDLLRGVWKTYLLPMAPGLILMYLAPVLAHPERAWRAFWPFAATVVFFVFVGELNRRVAKKIQARIDSLERAS